eukprot:CAMPEP_0114662770 /NCGR_PEP_ID=MMETSP0191-20121206/25519_1 /TAXON_ID=126664 /ORGANISM="Sorites sp." /LENGTH=66 /DNA_ID=CAMNT_0001900003 /DNA_START=32 /DNA_END=229 /DNA_ORIENTATION=-
MSSYDDISFDDWDFAQESERIKSFQFLTNQDKRRSLDNNNKNRINFDNHGSKKSLDNLADELGKKW